MLKDKSKELAALIVAGPPKEMGRSADTSEESADGEDDAEMDEGKLAAAEEAMSAMRSGDAKSFAEALKAFVDMCQY